MSRTVFASTLTALLLHAAAAWAEDEPPERRASIWVRTSRTTIFVGEVVSLTLDIEYDEPWFKAHATPLVRRAMDLPVRALVPAFTPGEELALLPSQPPLEPPEDSFALGDDVVIATAHAYSATLSVESGRKRHRSILQLARRYRVTKPGAFTFGAPTLEFAWAERFESDLLGDPSPVNTQRVVVQGAPLTLTARTVPSEGRPEDFAGLIGRYTLSASVDRAEVSAGEPLRLTLTLVGEGNHETLPVPGFDGLKGFHVLGTLDEQTPERRTLQIDLVPSDASVREIPPLRLAFFNPERGAFDAARTEAIPLTVRGTASTPPPAPPPAQEPPKQTNWFLPALLALVVVAGACFWLWRKSLREPGLPGAAPSLEPALAKLRAAAHAGSPEASEALLEVLAQHLKTTPAALVDAHLASELEASGLPRPLAERAAAAVEAGVAARYAGPHAAAATLPPGLVEELEQALRATRSA